MKVLVIARVAHEINRAYCASLGDTSQPSWDEAPEWQQKSAIAGVEMHLANPDATPEQSHESWLKQKTEEGWVYGEVKDAEKKQHPCCVPYGELPAEQKAKDYLFRAVVHQLKDIPDAEEAVAEYLKANPVQAASSVLAPAIPAQSGCVGVKYIGRRPFWKDTVYHSGVTFSTDQVRALPQALAAKLLRHIDLFEEAEFATAQQDDTGFQIDDGKKIEAAKRERDIEFDVIGQINQMDKKTLADFAMTRFQLKVNTRNTLEQMRKEVSQHVDRFGAV
ncbi:hypothetical protein vBPaeMUSP18_17 [Pseudomonas phage vB_PaeM_USP_18]|nr:hypothetical protein vBPaeMUSP18_17 [Pseudomonas phage vB_PaeM_USP_18]QLI49486.1 hypothetical protein vBPaeMUSP25_17 [Pseudomonas phage vB_PaeM_USP_25]